jgi:hypothetical protein
VVQALTVTSFGFSDFNALDSLRSDIMADTIEKIDDLRSSAVDLNHHHPRVEKFVFIEQNLKRCTRKRSNEQPKPQFVLRS